MIAPSQIRPFLSVTPAVIVSKVYFIGNQLVREDGIWNSSLNFTVLILESPRQALNAILNEWRIAILKFYDWSYTPGSKYEHKELNKI